jgi:hypothetical protein
MSGLRKVRRVNALSAGVGSGTLANYGAAVCHHYRNVPTINLLLLRNVQREKLNEIEIALRSRSSAATTSDSAPNVREGKVRGL